MNSQDGPLAIEDVPRVAVVVVHWRGMAETRECLESLARVTYPKLDVVIVTNGPEDFDPELAVAAYPGATVLASPRNLGYAGGCNLGAQAAIQRGAAFVLVLNNDTVVQPHLFEALVSAMHADPGVGVVAPMVTYYDAPTRVWSAGGYLHWTLGYTRHHLLDRDVPPPEPPRAVDFVSGCALMVRGTLWKRLGGMDERYFHYFEDVDLCMRARRLGFETCVVPSVFVQHKVSVSAGTRGSNRLNRLQAYYFSRNRMLMVHRCFRGRSRCLAATSQLLVLLPYDVVRALLDDNVSAAAGRLVGAVDGLRRRDGPALGHWAAPPERELASVVPHLPLK